MNDRLYATCESNLKQCVLFLGEKRINGNMFCYDFIKMLCKPIVTVCKCQIYIAWVAKWKVDCKSTFAVDRFFGWKWTNGLVFLFYHCKHVVMIGCKCDRCIAWLAKWKVNENHL